MIKVTSGRYFADVQENQNLNRYLKENPESDSIFRDYIKQKFGATFVYEVDFAEGSVGYFLFENERDAIMFILRFG
jgi:hypothetical protein